MTVDVEWAHPAVLDDLVSRLDERNLRATFFCTHDGIAVPGHERALHPNFRRCGNTLLSDSPSEANGATDRDFYRLVVTRVRAFCPEAVGVRAHSLFRDSDLLGVYSAAGLKYDSSCFVPLVAGLQPYWAGDGMLELPLYWMDHWDLRERETGFELSALRLDSAGLKILAFHPTLVYLNAATPQQYEDAKQRYDDAEWLRRQRHPGRGIRTLFLELLDALAERPAPPVLAEVSARWLAENPRRRERTDEAR